MIVRDKNQFLACLGKTISWCYEKVNEDDPKVCLRSPALMSVFEDYGEDINAAWLSNKLIADILKKRDSISSLPFHGSNSGRVLLIAYEYTNHNTLTESETDGYFDEHDNPPWDTWICEIQCKEEPREKSLLQKLWPKTLGSILDNEEYPSTILAAWVPDCFIETVQYAINVECCDMLFWADQEYPESTLAPNYKEVIPDWFQNLYQHHK